MHIHEYSVETEKAQHNRWKMFSEKQILNVGISWCIKVYFQGDRGIKYV